MIRACSLVLLVAGCGAARAPLPAPAAERSWVAPLPEPEDSPPPAPPQLPPMVSSALPCGLTVQIVEQRSVPVVYAALVGRGSTGSAPHVELDALLELALNSGASAGDDPSEDEHDGARVNERGIVLTSRVTPSDLDRVLARYLAVLEGSALDDDRVEVARAALLGRVTFERAQRSRASSPPPTQELFSLLYGREHPRVRRMRMRASAVQRVDTARVRRHLARMAAPAESALVVVGDVDAAALESAIRERFAILAPGSAAPRTPGAAPEFPDPDTRLRIFGTRPEPSAIIRLVERGPAIEHEDYAAFRLFARLAGGMFSSGLNLRLRESRGDAYGVITRVSDRFDHSVLELSVVVPVGAAGAAAASVVEELARLSDPERIDAEELEIARTVELAELAASLDTSTGLGRALVAAFLAREAPSSIDDTYARVAALDAAAVAAAARRWVRPEKAPMVIVGDYLWLFTHPVRVPGGVGFVGH